MSSLSAARADNYYYPREWRPELGSINQFQGSHPLGKRAKHLASDGVLVVRFEMPFNVWCTHCETHIGRGVRFNAKKRKCGMYFTTILYEFALTCAHCQGEMVIRTDPANRGYDLVSGVRKKVEGADVVGQSDEHDALDGTERLNDPHVAQLLQSDPFYRLEHEHADKRVAQQRAQGLSALLTLKDAHDKDNYASNAGLRAAFRSEKKQIQRREDEGAKRGLSIPLLDVHDDDVAIAKAMVYKNIPGKRRRTATRRSTPSSSSSARSRELVAHPKASATSHRRSSSSVKRPAASDSFQHFGDALGSHLHRMKAAMRAHKQQQSTLSVSSSVATTKRSASDSALRLEARARKLLRR